jgi:uncharacterized protein YbaR (Trm112 family)
MSDKKCKPIEWFECPECRGELEAFTEAEEDFFFDDDPVQCANCGWEGRIIIVDNEALVEEIGLYDDNPKNQ